MFCDLVGSTPLPTRFDPKDLREIVGAYQRCVSDTVGRFVAKYMGDGVLVYFGYPEAHKDDAERAASSRPPRGTAGCRRIGAASPLVQEQSIMAALKCVAQNVAHIPVSNQTLDPFFR
jgi:class 3 adenylate cyclase